MSMHRVPANPVINPETETFWAAANEGSLLLGHCSGCGRLHYYPRPVCPLCGAEGATTVPASGRGTIYTYSIMRKAEVPYIIAYVELEEGVKLLTNLVDIDMDDIAIGAEVQLRFIASEDGQSVPYFSPFHR
jgi:uncharacterized OB-fold protein